MSKTQHEKPTPDTQCEWRANVTLTQLHAKRQSVEKIDLRSAELKLKPEAFWQALRERGPTITTRQPLLGRICLTTRFEESKQILTDTRQFSVDARRCGHAASAGMRWWVPGLFKPLANNLLTLDGDEHRALRKRVDYAFKRTELSALQANIETEVSRAVHTFNRNIQNKGHADFVADVARPVPQRVISHLLGLNEEFENRHPAFGRDLSSLTSMRSASDLLRATPAIRRISAALNAEIHERRNRPRTDFLTRMIVEHGDGLALSDEQLLSMTFLLYVAGHETTTHLMSASLWAVLYNDEIREQMTKPLADNHINEFLRYLSPVQLSKPRFVVKNMSFAGALLKKGDTIAALIACANQDERVFDNGQTLNLENASPRHLGFGAGPHTCFGLHLALRETSTTLNRFITNPTLRLAQGNQSFAWNSRLGLRTLKYLNVVATPC